MIMEAEKSHDVLSASWRPRKPGGVVRSKSKGLKIRRLEFAVQGQEKTNVRAQLVRQRVNSPTLQFFCSIQTLKALDVAHPHWGG